MLNINVSKYKGNIKMATVRYITVAFVVLIQQTLLASTGEMYYSLGQEYMQKKNYELAILSFSKAVEQDPNWAEAHNALGEAYFFLFKYDEALKEFDKAIELKNDYTLAKINRNRTLRAIDRYEPVKGFKPKLWHKIAVVSGIVAGLAVVSLIALNYYS